MPTPNYEALSQDELNENIAMTIETMNRLYKKLSQGFTIEEEVRRELSIIFHDHFDSFLQNKGVQPCINFSNWELFINDRRAWEGGSAEFSTSANPWLIYTHLFPEKEENLPYGYEATNKDKISFFKLLDAFFIPDEYYLPYPSGIIVPDDHHNYHHSGNAHYIGPDIWISDDDLLSGNAKDTYTLVDHYGLKAVISDVKHIVEENGRQYYSGEGTVEGYTSDRRRKIQVWVRNGKIHTLFFDLSDDDWDVYNHFPLWADALKHKERKNQIYQQYMDSLFEKGLKRASSQYNNHPIGPKYISIVNHLETERENIIKSLRRGKISEDEAIRLIADLELSVTPFLPRWCANPWTNDKWLRMQDDYRLWRLGLPCNSQVGEEWLKNEDSVQPKETINPMKEAFNENKARVQLQNRVKDDLGLPFTPWKEQIKEKQIDVVVSDPVIKSTFFSLIDVVMKPLSCFRYIKEEPFEAPKKYAAVGLTEIYFSCVDDGGLFADKEPTGKHYTLREANGIRLDITINKIGYGFWTDELEYYGTGYVTDYMEETDHGITITSIKKDGSCFIIKPLFENIMEAYAYENYPRWKPYFAKIKRVETELMEARREMLRAAANGIK